MDEGSDRIVSEMIDALDPSERAAVVALWADELVRGWIPKRSDLEAALNIIRRERP